MSAIGEVGLAALHKLTEVPQGVARCDERLLEKLLRRVLNDLDEFSDALTNGQSGRWHPGAAGWMPDLMAESEGHRFLAGLEVKTRANINWGWYGTERWQSQLDRYADRAREIGGERAPLYLIVAEANRERVERELSAIGEWRIASASRWTVLTLQELLQRVPEPLASSRASSQGPAVELLGSLLAEP